MSDYKPEEIANRLDTGIPTGPELVKASECIRGLDELVRMQAERIEQLEQERDEARQPGYAKAAMLGMAEEIAQLKQERDEARERLREEIMSAYDSLTVTRKARYSGPEEYADAVLLGEKQQ